jgi:adenylosuccinate lyase
MVVYPKQIERYIKQELPFMATEKILMAAVEKGKSRQEMHEAIKVHSVAAGKVVKEEGKDNDLLDRLAKDDTVPFNRQELDELIGDGSDFIGRAPEQTEEYLTEVVEPRLAQYRDFIGEIDSTLNV